MSRKLWTRRWVGHEPEHRPARLPVVTVELVGQVSGVRESFLIMPGQRHELMITGVVQGLRLENGVPTALVSVPVAVEVRLS